MASPPRGRCAAATVALLALALLVAGCGARAPIPGSATPETALAPPTGPLGAADGVLERGVPPGTDTPAITRLEPPLRAAIRRAADAASDDGVQVLITSGWRSARYQQTLFDEAVQRYGSVVAARRMVAPADASEHVTGDAVDVGPTEAAAWMVRHGERFGLCQVYANEMWHFELKSGSTCPELLEDASARVRHQRAESLPSDGWVR